MNEGNRACPTNCATLFSAVYAVNLNAPQFGDAIPACGARHNRGTPYRLMLTDDLCSSAFGSFHSNRAAVTHRIREWFDPSFG
jgi:hypothetical protein